MGDTGIETSDLFGVNQSDAAVTGLSPVPFACPPHVAAVSKPARQPVAARARTGSSALIAARRVAVMCRLPAGGRPRAAPMCVGRFSRVEAKNPEAPC